MGQNELINFFIQVILVWMIVNNFFKQALTLEWDQRFEYMEKQKFDQMLFEPAIFLYSDLIHILLAINDVFRLITSMTILPSSA